MVPHLGHAELVVVVVRSSIFMRALVKDREKKNAITVTDPCYMTYASELTFAGLHALKPLVVYVFVCSTSAVLVPSGTRSATTDSAGFRKRAALWARHIIARADD